MDTTVGNLSASRQRSGVDLSMEVKRAIWGMSWYKLEHDR
jgi:hypothetical protein